MEDADVYIRRLSRDCVMHVFSFLSVEDRNSVSLVCRQWLRFERMLAHDMRTEVDMRECRLILRRFPFIRSLNLKVKAPETLMFVHDNMMGQKRRLDENIAYEVSTAPTEEDITKFLRTTSLGEPLQVHMVAGTKLEHFRFCNCDRHEMTSDISNGWLRAFERRQSLKSIVLCGCPGLPDSLLAPVMKQKMFERIELMNCLSLTDVCLTYLSHCKKLEAVKISKCPKISSSGIAFLLHEGRTNLKILEFEEQNLAEVVKRTRRDDADESEHEDVSSQGTFVSAIEQLTLKGCISSIEWLERCFASCKGLKVLEISACIGVGDRFLELLSQSSPGLLSLSVRDCEEVSDQGIMAVASSCHSLETLSISGLWEALTGEGICAALEGCPDLKVLSVKWCPGVASVYHSEDRNVINLIPAEVITQSHIPAHNVAFGIQESNLGVAASAPTEIVQSSNGQAVGKIEDMLFRLTDLDLEGLNALESESLTALVKHCPHLRSLRLAYCRGISTRTWREVGSFCRQLRELSLAGFKGDQIIDCELLAMLENCNRITALSLQKCPGIEAAGLVKALKTCQGLRSLNWDSCGGGSELAMAELHGIALQQGVRLLNA
eukprot:TRINITY_DN6556_c0_g1_i1.p1 TRINITY_DN6556_c0_g1~~TRINITY_DN6556_c0_g1_i1.p1  ORF type:complete len:606 (-),score=101.99 TRINITY_DN6556_c0_g1_i1:143-1960(-)